MVILAKIHKEKKNKPVKVNNNDLNSVKQDGLNIRNIDNPSYEMKLCAVQQNGLALKYIKEQTDEICIAAVKQNKEAAPYIIDPSLRLRLTDGIDENVFHPDLTIDDLIDEASKIRTVKPPTGGFAEEMKHRSR
jgi:hypothetical protein